MIDLTRDGDVHTLMMTAEPNTVQPDFLAAMHAALDEVEALCEQAGALVLTGTGKTFNTGLDVPVVMGLTGDDATHFGVEIMRLMKRLVAGPVPTVAAINGHAFAAGAFLALGCDFRVMREDRGWFCISEIDVGVPIGRPMMSLLKAKVPATAATEAVLTGKRYSAEAALASGFVDSIASESGLLDAAKLRAAELATKQRGICSTLKHSLWQDLAAELVART